MLEIHSLLTCSGASLCMFQALYDCRIRAIRIPGQVNYTADDLSGNRSKSFLTAHPSVSPQSTQVPQIALNCLTQVDPTWTSQAWRESSRATICGGWLGTIFMKGLCHCLEAIHTLCYRVSPLPSPMTAEMVILFVAFLCTQGLSLSTIKSYFAGFYHACILVDPSHLLPSFHTPYVKRLFQGIAWSSANPTHPRLPIIQSIMNRTKSILAQEPRAFANQMMKAAYCAEFFGFSDAASFLSLMAWHSTQTYVWLWMTSPMSRQWICLTWSYELKPQRPAKLCRGTTISLGFTRGELWPVAALFDYLNAHGEAPGPFFYIADRPSTHLSSFCSSVATCSQPGWTLWQSI